MAVLILGTLFILTIISLISIISGATLFSTSIVQDTGGNIIVNGSTSTVALSGTVNIDVSALAGIIALIIVITVLVGVIGLQVVGSGLNSESVRVIFLGTVYTSLWTFLSFLSAGLIIGIQVFGALIYMVLTIVYVIGVIRHLGGSSA